MDSKSEKASRRVRKAGETGGCLGNKSAIFPKSGPSCSLARLSAKRASGYRGLMTSKRASRSSEDRRPAAPLPLPWAPGTYLSGGAAA